MSTRTLTRPPRPAPRRLNRAQEFSRTAPMRPVTPFSRPHQSPLALPDEAVQRAVEQRLAAFGVPVAQSVETDVRQGEVTLTGAVASDYERQTIELTIGRVVGVQRLVNLINVGANVAPVSEAPAAVDARSSRLRWLAAAGAAVAAAALAWAAWQWASPLDAANRVAAMAPVCPGHADCPVPTAGRGSAAAASAEMHGRMLCSARKPDCCPA